MAVVPTLPVVSTTRSVVASVPASGDIDDYRTRRFIIKNRTNTASVFLGGNAVTTGNGFEWQVSDGPLEIALEPGESLYAIIAVTDQTLHVLQSGR